MCLISSLQGWLDSLYFLFRTGPGSWPTETNSTTPIIKKPAFIAVARGSHCSGNVYIVSRNRYWIVENNVTSFAITTIIPVNTGWETLDSLWDGSLDLYLFRVRLHGIQARSRRSIHKPGPYRTLITAMLSYSS